MNFLKITVLLFLLASCKKDPTIVELTVLDGNLIPVDSAQVIFTADPYNSFYSGNQIIVNDTFYTDSTGYLQVDYSDRQTNGQTGFMNSLVKVSSGFLSTEFNLNIPQFKTTRKKIILQ